MRTIALMLESDEPGGAEVFLIHSAEELRERGYRTVPVLPSWKSGWLAQQLRERGFEPVTFTMKRAIDWECLRDLVIQLEKARVDVIHSHEFAMAVYGTAAAKILKRRHIITMHANMWMTGALRRRLALRWAFSASYAAVAVSDDFRSHLISSLGLESDSILTIPNGIPDPGGDPSPPAREFGLRNDEVILIAAGNLSERKGHMVLLRALALLEQRGCTIPWRLIIAGEGPERPRLEAIAKEKNLEAFVHLPGHRSDVGNLQAAAEITVMPSLWEGLPLAVLEGMFSGNAIVGSRISGIPEAVRHGIDGLLVPPGDSEALAAALQSLLENDQLRREMGRAARKRALERFSITRMMNDYELLYWGSPDSRPNVAKGLAAKPGTAHVA